jgi:hypothetical protein
LLSPLFFIEGDIMDMYPSRRLRPLAIVLLAALGAGAGAADMNEGRASAAARYEVERAMCLRGESHQDTTTCLREAGAAYEQAKRIGLKDDSAQLVANRFLRCDRLPDEQRRDCMARMEGQGTISGSVTGGGIYRELVTIVEEDDGARDD